MTSLTIAKLISDALLCASIIFLSLRILKKQPGGNTNWAKLKELELSLKDVVKQADEASQNFNEELLSRKKDLEKVLTNAQEIEARLSKADNTLDESIRDAELAKRGLEGVIQKSIQEIKLRSDSLNQLLTDASEYGRAEAAPEKKRKSARLAKGKEILPQINTYSFEYDQMPEPPSFSQLSEATSKKTRKKPVATRSVKPSGLSQQIEKSIDTISDIGYENHRTIRPLHESLNSVAQAAERSINATRLPDHLEETLASIEDNQQRTTREDPRLGVLAGTRRTTQVI